MEKQTAHSADMPAAGLVARPSMDSDLPAPRARFEFVCRDAAGREKWRDGFDNLVTNAGRTNILDTFLKGAGYTAAWFLVLKGTGAPAAGDTLAAHAGWTELNPYAGSNRPAITWGTTTGGSNTSETVGITINAPATVAGAGVCASQPVAENTGVLYNIGDFSSARTVDVNDTLSVTITLNIT